MQIGPFSLVILRYASWETLVSLSLAFQLVLRLFVCLFGFPSFLRLRLYAALN